MTDEQARLFVKLYIATVFSIYFAVYLFLAARWDIVETVES